MRSNRLVFSLSLIGILLCGACASLQAPSSQGFSGREPTILDDTPPLTYVPPSPETWQLTSGLTVLYLEDREVPTVRGSLIIPGGTLWDPPKDKGASSVMGALLRHGGAGAHHSDALDLELQKRSAAIESSIGAEYGSVSFGCLREDLSTVFSLFSDVIFRPRFDPVRLKLFQSQALESIRRRKDDPETIVSIALDQLLYGDTVYGRSITSKDISLLNQKMVEDAYRRWLSPTKAFLMVSGHTSRSEIEELIQQYFGGWEAPSPITDLTPPPMSYRPHPGIVFIPSSFSQSTVVAAQLGVPRLTSDRYAIQVFNQIFGGGSGSRLFSSVRTDLGLAYSVDGAISPGLTRGKNSIVLQTSSSTTGQALIESLRVLKNLQQEMISLEDLQSSKRALTNSFVFANADTDSILRRQALSRLLGYSADYDQTLSQKIWEVTPQDIKKVAESRWNDNDWVIVVVGNEEAYQSLKKARLSGGSSGSQRLDLGETLMKRPIRRIRFNEVLETW